MKTSTTIKEMLAGNKIFVPNYQRAYAWDTESEKSSSPKQVNTFLTDLEDYNKSATTSQYYFGHFLFEERGGKLGIIDGQQRLTTIIIFLSALFTQLKKLRDLEEDEVEIFEDIIKRNSTYRFETVDYDDRFFKDYVIDQKTKNKNEITIISAKRIAEAFDFFISQLADKNEAYLLKMLDTIQNASCTTHLVQNESEAIQMFIFQNNRGKKPSNLEIIKAQFMFNIHLYGGEEKEELIKEIKDRFEKIYESISSIESYLDEDDVLVSTLRVHFNSLGEINAIDKINEQLLSSKENPIIFIEKFSQLLAASFMHLKKFFCKDEKDSFDVHSLISLGKIGIVMPFIIKAYEFGLDSEQINLLCKNLESIVLRKRLIGTRADITSRLNDVYKQFSENNPSIQPIINRIEFLKTTQDWYWAYWNNNELARSIQGSINPLTAKFLLWKYENHLENQGKKGYANTRFNTIKNPELEHIAPKTPAGNESLAAGYPAYDDEFRNQYIECLGNYLLLSKSHNCSIGNKPFLEKRSSYNHLEQQREIQRLTENDSPVWTKELIQQRKEKIITFIIENM